MLKKYLYSVMGLLYFVVAPNTMFAQGCPSLVLDDFTTQLIAGSSDCGNEGELQISYRNTVTGFWKIVYEVSSDGSTYTPYETRHLDVPTIIPLTEWTPAQPWRLNSSTTYPPHTYLQYYSFRTSRFASDNHRGIRLFRYKRYHLCSPEQSGWFFGSDLCSGERRIQYCFRNNNDTLFSRRVRWIVVRQLQNHSQSNTRLPAYDASFPL